MKKTTERAVIKSNEREMYEFKPKKRKLKKIFKFRRKMKWPFKQEQ